MESLNATSRGRGVAPTPSGDFQHPALRGEVTVTPVHMHLNYPNPATRHGALTLSHAQPSCLGWVTPSVPQQGHPSHTPYILTASYCG